MTFHPKNLEKAEGSFVFSGQLGAVCHPCLCKDIFRELWQNFTFGLSTLLASETDEYIFSTGGVAAIDPDGYDYTINIEPRGVCVCAKSEVMLIRGFMTLIDRFGAAEREDETVVEAISCKIRDRASVEYRMIHFCVFPETELWELRRFVRFCGALKYTHIVLEFWGMLRFDCMKELSWSHGFTKEQIRPIVCEANELGMQVIPMFNHWGHASAGRVIHGKHVVLDQNPALQTYFAEDGWCWDIKKPKVRALLSRIREELIELCGKGDYFHIGCDEAYNFEFTRENMDLICDFINEISRDMSARSRRVIAWGDMFLYKYPHYDQSNRYTCNAPSPEVESYLLSRLDRSVIIADWQYDCVNAPVETAAVFTKAGFDCLLCPYDKGYAQVTAPVATAREQGLMGIMHTTWHTLSKGMPCVTIAAAKAHDGIDTLGMQWARTYTAALLRRVMPVRGEYEKAGWSRLQIYSCW